jgi:formylglycine-generating enzyme required for sulfatase activity
MDWHGVNAYTGYKCGNLTPPSSGMSRVLRGGSWGDVKFGSFSCHFRFYYHPTFRYRLGGFRCAGTV